MARRRARRQPGRSFLLLLFAGALVAAGYYLGLRAEHVDAAPVRSEPARAAVNRTLAAKRAPAARPARVDPPAVAEAAAPMPAANVRIAIVIDDLGRSTAEVDRLLALGVPLTYAVLPWESRTAEVLARLRGAGVEILCHLPMEASGGQNPGPNAILEKLPPERIGVLTRAALDALPGATGMNNHMGSAITSDPVAMNAVLAAVAERHLFFLDSRTTKESVAFTLARQLSIPAASRDVFLDEAPSEAEVEAAFDQFLALAKEKGSAIAIGHPHDETLRVLERRIPFAKAAGYEFVPVSFLLERDGSEE